jgi:phosphoribosylformylglycinamidine synthase
VGRARHRHRRGRRGDRLVVQWHGEVVVDVPPGSLADDGPVYERPIERPADQDDLVAAPAPAYPSVGELRELLLRMVASPNLCSRRWVVEQYDRIVLGDTVLAWPEDAGVVRLSESGLGVALATDGNGRYARLDPYAGAQLALAEAYRNVAATGAVPIAVTNCLNFGSPRTRPSCGSSPRPPAAWPTAAGRSGRRSPAATSASTTRPPARRSTRRR